MRKGARTVLCGGCRVTGIPTATGRLSSTKTLYLLFNGSQRWGWHPRRSSRLGLFRLVGGKLVDVETADQVRRAINAKTAALIMVSDADLASRLLLQAAEKDDR
jgi:hypothetical protein